ncbi:response regulator [Paenibacillus thermotolerans]|uniref:response regulator n=1 Tax=Paenibacillus thermotolerans TaxID=3027807 RepID=UPI002367DF87|nr:MULTISPECIES: response regulator [unclassified Paenibacillus]
MKIILVDDERLALNYLEHQLQKIADVRIVGKFDDPIAGKESILREDVDVAFLDIQMLETNGIELAEQILEHKPKLNIVFVTAYNDYAIQAFELNALDYVLKPVGTERLLKTIQRIQERLGEASAASRPKVKNIQLKMFQHISIQSEEHHFATIRWRTTKAQELFLYLLQNREQLVRKSALIELLWPEFEPGKAYSHLYTAVYHVRKTLEPYGAYIKIANATEGYILHTEHVLIDVEEWEQRIQSGPPVTAETIDHYERVMVLYAGDYLQGFDYWWAESERQRLKILWLRMSFRLAEWYVSCGRREKAMEKYLEICDRYPQAEEAHFALMKLFSAMNNHLLVHRQYRLLTTVLMEEINEKPSPYITEWYNRWNQETKE